MSVTIGAVIASFVVLLASLIVSFVAGGKYNARKMRQNISEERIKARDEINKRIKEYKIRRDALRREHDGVPGLYGVALAKLNLEYTDITGKDEIDNGRY